ncbi:hypothetical protein PMZ80_002997 [Knufia obscura]|uniref:F-box domain-containing protein n=1 Tax=Knufia obscura TaxID=1635080 RepID=A0ABR0S0C4_9EURO|nr:hypothetical protein PMZ80_002997 [Knufia obscura]
MVHITALPSEVLRKIFKEVREDDDNDDPNRPIPLDPDRISFFTLAYVNTQFRSIALDLHHNEDTTALSLKERKRKVAQMREAEAKAYCTKLKYDYDTSGLQFNSELQIALLIAKECSTHRWKIVRRAGEVAYASIQDDWEDEKREAVYRFC